jgi:hypothetical protein
MTKADEQTATLILLALYTLSRGEHIDIFYNEVMRVVINIHVNMNKSLMHKNAKLIHVFRLAVHATAYFNKDHHLFSLLEIYDTSLWIMDVMSKPMCHARIQTEPDMMILICDSDDCTQPGSITSCVKTHRNVMASISRRWQEAINSITCKYDNKYYAMCVLKHFEGFDGYTASDTFTVTASVFSIFVSVVYSLKLHNRLELYVQNECPVTKDNNGVPSYSLLVQLPKKQASVPKKPVATTQIYNSNVPTDDQSWRFFQQFHAKPAIISMTHRQMCSLYAFLCMYEIHDIAEFAFSALIRQSHGSVHGAALLQLAQNEWTDWEVMQMAGSILVLGEEGSSMDDDSLLTNMQDLFL